MVIPYSSACDARNSGELGPGDELGVSEALDVGEELGAAITCVMISRERQRGVSKSDCENEAVATSGP